MIASLLVGVAHIVSFVLDILTFLIIASALISWVDANPRNQIVSLIQSLTEPLYRPFRKISQKIGGPFDLAPMFLMLIIIFIKSALPHYLLSLARQLGSQPFPL
jgi:YggT family protein